ncbi:MAG: hypothetical protein JW829_08075 [Pirellulales bacterium]|nr:hypothetical protein [Pirellulales bacterium]
MMDEETEGTPESEDDQLEREIRSGRKFTLAEAIGRLGGKDLLKGTSPVTRKRQAELEVEQYLKQNLIDAEFALEVVLLRRVRNSEILLDMEYDQPLAALVQLIESFLGSDALLHDFVDEVDAEWGRISYERPHFQQEGHAPDRDDPYTFTSVRTMLRQLLQKLRASSEET